MAQVEQDKLLAEIAKDEDHTYFDKLRTNETAIDWLAAHLHCVHNDVK